VAESWLSRHNLIVPEWSKRPDLCERRSHWLRRVPRSLRRVSSITTINSSISCGEEVGSRVSSIGLWILWPPGIDVAHLRLNLSVLYSSALAQQFLDLYEATSGRTVERWWDVEGLLKYLPAGVASCNNRPVDD